MHISSSFPRGGSQSMKLTTHDDDDNDDDDNNLIPRFTIHGNIPPHPQMLS